VAAVAQILVESVRRVLDAMRVAVARNLRETCSCRIPGLVHFRVRVLPAREAHTKMISGKACVWKARQHETKKLAGSALQQLSAAIA
jgi:nucleoid DNA-binding protein